jgi:sensor histidine kinase YesM
MKWKEIHFRWLGTTVVALLLVFIMKQDMPGTFLEKFGMSFIITAFFWNGAVLMFLFYRRKFPLIRETPKRLVYTIFSLLIFLFAGDIIFCMVLNGKQFAQLFTDPLEFFQFLPISMAVSLIVGSFYENAYFFDQWRHAIQINEALKNQQIRTQFEVLQNQMSPHFLFNSLNALNTLIGEDQEQASKFTENLSDVYRYILQNKEKELVTLEEELAFVKSYAFLQQMRYPANLDINFNIAPHLLQHHIAPLTLQILLENSVKHNVISKTHPLRVDIFSEGDHSIVVKNVLRKKNVLEKSTKTGLNNITRRYEYLTKRAISINDSEGVYRVSVPLLKVTRGSLLQEI